MNKKVEHFEEKINEINQNEYEDEDGGQGGGGTLDNYIFWLEIIKDEITNRNQEELLELIKNGNSNFINELKKAKELAKKRKKKKKMLQDGSTDMNNDNDNNNNNSDKNNNSKKLNKNIYKIFSILNNNKQNANKEINEENENLLKLTENIDINDFTDLEYRGLLNKKEEYLETNMRLDNNIKNFAKTKNSKLSKITKSLKLKEVQLKIIKEKNKLVQEEVNNLENIYQLSLEKENIKKEINKKLNIKLTKIIPKKHEEKIIIKDKNYINMTNEKKIEKNESDLKKASIKENPKKEDDFPETRDEQLELIRKKYMENEENDNDNNNNENNDIDNMEKIDNTEKELNKEDLNEENKQFEEKENNPE
jgi:hypothetical protein